MAETFGLPCGYRFVPTDEELVNYYLRRKVEKKPLPRGVVKKCDIYSKNPWEIFDKSSSDYFYVFTKLKKKNNKTRIERTAGSGTWKNRFSKRFNDAQGKCSWFKKDYVFELNKKQSSADSSNNNGHWIMQEFSLQDEGSNSYVLCKISNKNARDSHKEKQVITVDSDQISKRKFSSSNEEEEDQNLKKMRLNSHCLPVSNRIVKQDPISHFSYFASKTIVDLETELEKFWVPLKEQFDSEIYPSMPPFRPKF